LQHTAANQAAADTYGRTLDAYLAFARDTGQRLKDTLSADPEMPMAHVLRGIFFNLMGMPALLPKAAESLARAQGLEARANPRERLHMLALAAWCDGSLERSIEVYESILRSHPRDILALKLAAYLCFYLGDAAGIRDCVARVLPAWSPAVPAYASVLGMHAFGLEECGDYADAEHAGRKAVEMNPADPWSVHAVAHVLEMQDRRREGIDWISGLRAHWDACNNFRYHLWWHLALVHVALERYDEALALYDRSLYDPQSEEYLDLCNDIALLARLEMAGVDVGTRWEALIDKVERQRAGRVLAFVDAHYVIATAAAQGEGVAHALAGQLQTYAATGTGTTARVTAEVGLPLADALIAYQTGDYSRCVQRLYPLRGRWVALGGSHAQRDLFAQMLIDAALKCGQFALARALLAERIALRPNNLWGWRASEKAHAGLGDAGAAAAAHAQAARLGKDAVMLSG
jgi:tetratricopeptide (TPR) repeat protein